MMNCKYKIGDKLLCKENFVEYISGKYYIISNLTTDNNNVYIRRKKLVRDSGDWFGINNVHKNFYTIQEIRKLKLKQLRDEI